MYGFYAKIPVKLVLRAILLCFKPRDQFLLLNRIAVRVWVSSFDIISKSISAEPGERAMVSSGVEISNNCL